MSTNAQDVNLWINVIVILFNLGASLFPFYWLKLYNHDYKDGLRLVTPALAVSCVISIMFGMLYAFRIFNLITNVELQALARLILLGFLFTPFTLVLSLHNWKK